MKNFLLGIIVTFVVSAIGYAGLALYRAHYVAEQAEYERIFSTFSPAWKNLIRQSGMDETIVTYVLTNDSNLFTGINPEQYQYLYDNGTNGDTGSDNCNAFKHKLDEYLHADTSGICTNIAIDFTKPASPPKSIDPADSLPDDWKNLIKQTNGDITMMNVILKNSVSLVEISPEQATYLIKRYASSHEGTFNDDDSDFKNEVTKRVSLDVRANRSIVSSPEQQAIDTAAVMLNAASAAIIQSQQSGATTRP